MSRHHPNRNFGPTSELAATEISGVDVQTDAGHEALELSTRPIERSESTSHAKPIQELRIDRAHSIERPGLGDTLESDGDSAPEASPSFDRDVADGDQWLKLHARDLIDRVQSWANDLQRREDHLTRQLLEHDRARRALRKEMQKERDELSRQADELGRLRVNLERQAHIIALESL
ncbi:MAG: hypothetical protein AAGJ40_21925 [Planctomycetota bacterium]